MCREFEPKNEAVARIRMTEALLTPRGVARLLAPCEKTDVRGHNFRLPAQVSRRLVFPVDIGVNDG